MKNPLDSFFINISEKLNPIWLKLKLTPNNLTLFSLICALIAIYLIRIKKICCWCIVIFTSYFFDCADGNYARKYNMVTKFGDLFDHISDITKIILLIYYIYNSNIQFKYKILFLIGFSFFGVITGIHMGCQEKLYDLNKNHNESLSIFKRFCNNTEMILKTKYFSCGSLQLFMFFYIITIPYLQN